MSGKELAMLESPGADIGHLVVCPCYMEGDEGRCLTGPLTKGEEAEESGCRYGGSCTAFLRPTDRRGVVSKHAHMLESKVFLDDLQHQPPHDYAS